MNIPQEAIEAAKAAIRKESMKIHGWGESENAVTRAALEAAAPFLRAQALEDAADELAAQRDATNHELTPEDGESVRDHNDGRFLGKTVAFRLLRARAATERGQCHGKD